MVVASVGFLAASNRLTQLCSMRKSPCIDLKKDDRIETIKNI